MDITQRNKTMNMWLTYGIITVILIIAELLYFRIADRCNIIDKPNEQSSHTKVVIRGGGVIFAVGLWVWSAFFGFQYPWMPASVLAHWIYLIVVALVLAGAYVVFMKKYYHLHEEYLESLKK